MNPTRVQVAIQGGGAKVVALLAAAEVLEQLEEQSDLRLTRVAGTSAGAIVACLLASQKIRVRDLRDQLRHQHAGTLRKLFPPVKRVRAYSRILRGKPLYDTDGLRKFLAAFFGSYGIHTLGELDLETFIITSDLLGGKKKVFNSKVECDRTIVDCLVDSCAMPFVFRAPRNLGEPTYVDGGICENLPSDELDGEKEKYGRVIGISFHHSPLVVKPKTVLDFSKSLLDTAIANSMARARRVIGEEHVFSIRTDLPTLGFQEALGDAIEAKYDNIKYEAREWFARHVPRKEPEDLDDRVMYGDPWETASASFQQTMVELHEVYERTFRSTPIEFDFSGMSVTSYDLLGPDDKRAGSGDVVIQKVRLRPTHSPLVCHDLNLGAPGESTFKSKAKWRVTDPEGANVRVRVFPVLDPAGVPSSQVRRGNTLRRKVLLFFDPPLAVRQDGWYTIIQQDVLSDAMRPLLEKGADELVNTNTRDVCIPHVQLCFVGPEGVTERTDIQGIAEGGSALGERARPGDLDVWGEPPPGFSALGWRFRDLKPGRSVVAKLRLR